MDRFKRIQMMCELLADDVPNRIDAVGHEEPVGFSLVLFYGDGTFSGATKATPELLSKVLRSYLASLDAGVAAQMAEASVNAALADAKKPPDKGTS